MIKLQMALEFKLKANLNLLLLAVSAAEIPRLLAA
jgi:hypothetical protein